MVGLEARSATQSREQLSGCFVSVAITVLTSSRNSTVNRRCQSAKKACTTGEHHRVTTMMAMWRKVHIDRWICYSASTQSFKARYYPEGCMVRRIVFQSIEASREEVSDFTLVVRKQFLERFRYLIPWDTIDAKIHEALYLMEVLLSCFIEF